MLKHKEITDPTSCLSKAEHDEPVFVLRANDELAPEIVDDWAQRYKQSKEAEAGRRMNDAQESKYREARQLADAMRAWKKAAP